MEILDDGLDHYHASGVPLERLNAVNLKLVELDRVREKLTMARSGAYALALLTLLVGLTLLWVHWIGFAICLVLAGIFAWCAYFFHHHPRSICLGLALYSLLILLSNLAVGNFFSLLIGCPFLYVFIRGYLAVKAFRRLPLELREDGVSAEHLAPLKTLAFVNILRQPTA